MYEWAKKTEAVGIHKIADRSYKELRGRRVRMRKEAREESEKSLMSVKKKKSWEWTAKNENASFSSNKGKLEGMYLYDVLKGTSWHFCQRNIKAVMGTELEAQSGRPNRSGESKCSVNRNISYYFTKAYQNEGKQVP